MKKYKKCPYCGKQGILTKTFKGETTTYCKYCNEIIDNTTNNNTHNN